MTKISWEPKELMGWQTRFTKKKIASPLTRKFPKRHEYLLIIWPVQTIYFTVRRIVLFCCLKKDFKMLVKEVVKLTEICRNKSPKN
jgi:hypothetical protein